jgi:hypothetical protein
MGGIAGRTPTPRAVIPRERSDRGIWLAKIGRRSALNFVGAGAVGAGACPSLVVVSPFTSAGEQALALLGRIDARLQLNPGRWGGLDRYL